MRRRRSLVAAVAIGVMVLAALAPGAALADQPAGGHPNSGVHVASTGGAEIENWIYTCATPSPCFGIQNIGPDSYVGPAPGVYAAADAYRYDGSSHATPDVLYGECDSYYVDGNGVFHDDYAYVWAHSVSGTMWLIDGGAESNTHAAAFIDAAGSGTGGFLRIQGYGQYNNQTDTPSTGSNFVVTIVGTIYHDTWTPGNAWATNSTTFGAMTCNTRPMAASLLFPSLPHWQSYGGEAEVDGPSGAS